MDTLGILLSNRITHSECYINMNKTSWVNGKCDVIISKGFISILVKDTEDWIKDSNLLKREDDKNTLLIETTSSYDIFTNCKFFLSDSYQDEQKETHKKYDFYFSDVVHADKENQFGLYSVVLESAHKMLLDFKLFKLNL